MFKKKIEVRNAVDNLFCGVELDPHEEKLVKNLNCDHLAQVFQHRKEIVYAYSIWTKEASCCEYRGEQLFPFPATLICPILHMISVSESGIISERFIEIWLTDDMRFVLVSNLRTDINDGEFISAYREVKATDLDEFQEIIDLDYNMLARLLAEMADEYTNSPMPTYEL